MADRVILLDAEANPDINLKSKDVVVSNPKNIVDEHHRENKLITILSDIANPSHFARQFKTEVIKSILVDSDPNRQMNNIVQAFNQGRKSIMTTSVFGHRINPDKFRIVVKNNVPELVPPTSAQLRKQLFVSPSTKTNEVGEFNQTDLFIGGYGSYLVNVPQGKIAKAWRGNIPILLGPGPHVIHDPNLRQVKADDLVDINTNYIQHSTYHIIWVNPGHCQKIWINTTPYFLIPSGDSPYVFNEPVFSKPENATPLNTGYITHGNFNIVQVPRGKVAKIWLNSTKPMLLEASDDPYVFTDPSFKLDPKNKHEFFEDASERLIIHGSIKRIMPRTGEVAITYNNGNLETIGPNPNKEPIIIKEVNHIFDRFLPINIQTMEFPSSKTVKKRIEENAVSKDDIDHPDVNYEVFRTSDGLPIGVKLLVIFEIDNPNLTLARLSPDNIISHIESIVVADMGLVIQNCSSTDFLKSNQPSVKSEVLEGELISPVADFYEHLQEKVFKSLKRDFAEYGIKLSRLNIETPKILDVSISSKMAEFSLMNTEAGAKIAVMDKNFNIAKRQAEQEANKKQIAQQQENDQRIAQAKAEMESSKLKAEARLIEVRADVEAQEMLLAISRKRAELYDMHPGLLQYELAKVNVDAVKGISTMVVSPEIASMVYNIPGFRLTDQNLIPRELKKDSKAH
jgi:hypothetical protein